VVQLIDVTLREAGIANGFSFSIPQVVEIARALDQSGVDIIEVGYLREQRPGVPPGGSTCDAEYLGAIRSVVRRARLAAMVHTGDVTLDTYQRLREFRFDLVRFTLSRKNHGDVERHAAAVRALGMNVAINVIRTTELSDTEVLEYGRLVERVGADCFYVADSNGGLYPDQLVRLARLLRRELRIPLGFHAHDNLTLAFANTLVALREGFTFIDGSLGGEGKGGGNLSTELICSHLAAHHRAAYDVFPLVRAHASAVAPSMPEPQSRLLSNLFGLLNLNIDQIAQLHGEAARTQMPLEQLLQSRYGTPILAPAARLGPVTASQENP
jgi:4-hydroxy 2-oxovalerate aldolase